MEIFLGFLLVIALGLFGIGLAVFVVSSFGLLDTTVSLAERKDDLFTATLGLKMMAAGILAPISIPVGLGYIIYGYVKARKELKEGVL